MEQFSSDIRERIRHARGKFAAMAITYFIGNFNDNFYKEAALLIAVSLNKPRIQSYITIIFTLPFLVFAAAAGWCADHFEKRTVIIAAKLLELTAMIFGALGMLYTNWTLILIMVGIEGTQAALISPALNGSIPELYPAQYVIKANAILRMITTAAILGGLAAAGIVIDQHRIVYGFELSRILISCIIITISITAILTSLRVARFPAASKDTPFPLSGPIHTLQTLYDTRRDRLLAVVIAANVFFWMLGSLDVLLINQLGVEQFKFSGTLTSLCLVAELVGVAAGGIISSYIARGERWRYVLAPACLVLGITMTAVAATPLLHGAVMGFSLPAVVLILLLLVMGIAGGIYMIPLEAFIQIRPAADRKGQIIAATNFACFTGILISGAVMYLFTVLHVAATNAFGIMGVLSLIIASLLWKIFKSEWLHV